MSIGKPMIKIADHSIGEKDCLTAVKNALGTSDFVLENYDVETVSDAPIGFMARHLRLTANVRVEGRPQVLRLFTKSPPASKNHRSFVVDLEYFQKEIVMYETLAPMMSKELPKNVTMPIPRCYLTKGNKLTEPEEQQLIVMEDVTLRGYRMRNKILPFDLRHCRLVMRSLARFHAPSFLLRHSALAKGRSGSFVDEVFLSAREMLLVRKRGNMGYQWAKNSIRTMVTAVAVFWPERFGTKEAREMLHDRLRKNWEEVFQLMKPSEKYANVLCHGDTWSNNVMFKYAREGVEEVPEDALLVDLQLIRFVPPAFDLLLLFYTSTTREFRERHLKDLLIDYQRYLENIITKEVLESAMPLNLLLQSMEDLDMFGKVISTAYLPLTLNDEDTVPISSGDSGDGEPPNFMELIHMDLGTNVLRNAEASKMYKKRVTDAFQEYLEYAGLWK